MSSEDIIQKNNLMSVMADVTASKRRAEEIDDPAEKKRRMEEIENVVAAFNVLVSFSFQKIL